MSLLSTFTKRSKLNATIKQTMQARKSEGHTADGLFKAAYQGYAEILQDDPLRADTLYNWGFALLHQAKTKTGAEADAIYQDAITKFSFCLLINPNYLGAAINGGVAYMDLARLNNVKSDDLLYDSAKKQFETANRIQAGTASYNLACIYALRNDQEACRAALENARNNGILPSIDDMLNDPDLANAKEQAWFSEFLEKLQPKTETVSEGQQAETKPAAEQPEITPTPAEQAAVEETAGETVGND